MSRAHGLSSEAEGAPVERGLAALLWNSFVASSVAMCAAVTLVGRTNPVHASLTWITVLAAVLVAVALSVDGFTRRISKTIGTRAALAASIVVNGPLAGLSAAATAALYLSDGLNHQATYFFQPTSSVVLVLAILATLVAQRAAVMRADGTARSIRLAVEASAPWAIPAALLALGLLQGGSYLWVVSNDFTRYWNVADAISSWSGYPAMRTLPLYVQIGEPQYTVDLPGYPLLLVAAFKLVGHDTLAAEIPNLLANAALPLLAYVFFHLAGVRRSLAFAGSVLLVTQPFFRLYTLNAPVPDAVFMALLVGTAISFQLSAGDALAHQGGSPPSDRGTAGAARPSPVRWVVFGLLAGATALERPEGLFFLAFMALALVPELRKSGPWIAAGTATVLLLSFAVLMRATFGFFWPNNAGSTMSLGNVEVNVHWLQVKTLERYAEAFQLSVNQFLWLLAVMTLCVVFGAVLLARDRPRLALLPVGAAINIAVVFTVDQSVSGVHLWFDFFRHVSYGLPFLMLPFLHLLERLSRLADRPGHSPRRGWRLRQAVPSVVALLLLGAAFVQMDFLSHPSDTYGQSVQLLTSDVWVSLQDIVNHRYQLPEIQLARDENGVLIPAKSFDVGYLVHHLDRVTQFFEPFSAINVGRGSQYEFSSMLVVLFGAIFAVAAEPRDSRSARVVC